MNRRVDVSHKTIFFIAGFLGLLWALFQIREVIILLFIAIIFMSALRPLVDWMGRHKVPRGLAVAITYILVVSGIAGLLSLVVTPLIEQTNNLVTTLPATLQQVLPNIGIDPNIIQQEVANFTKNAFSLTLTVFNEFIALISIAVLTFYLLLEREKLDQLIIQFIGREQKVKRVTNKIEEKLGGWLRGQLALSLIIGVMAYIVLITLGIPYALPLAILAGILEIVPVIGPIIASIPAILVALLVSPLMGGIVAIAFFVIQQLENHIIVPQVMKKAVGVNPLVVILAVAIGGKLLGVAGALLAVPIVVVIQVISEEILKENDK